MRLEESHDRGHKVPCKIDDSEEDNGAHSNLVGEQYLDVIQQARLLCRLFLCSKLSALLQLTLQVPGNESYDEQGEEHDARREGIDSLHRHISTTKHMSHTFHPTEEIASRGEEHAKQ